MKLEQVRYLLEINKLHSISAASRSLHIGQTTLSAIVKATEIEVGFPLFQRTPTGVTATPMGEKFMALAWEIDIKHEELLILKRRLAMGTNAVTALLSHSLAFSLSLPLTNLFYQHELHGNLSFEEYPSSLIGDRILDGMANIGIAYLSERDIQRAEENTDKNRLKVERLIDDQMLLLVSSGHRFAAAPSISAESICSERVALASAQKLRDDKVFGNLMLRCEKVTAVSSMDLVFRAVKEQNMVAVVPRYIVCDIPPEQMNNFRAVPLTNTEHENRLVICLLTCEGRTLRYPEKILKQCILEYFETSSGSMRKTASHAETGGENV